MIINEDGKINKEKSLVVTQFSILERSLYDGFQQDKNIPNIHLFFPKTQEEYEYQMFNLYCKIPTRFDDPDDIAMWILEGKQLNRKQVFNYFSDLEYDKVAKLSLERLARKILSLDVCQDFADGLKYFVPVVGCWDPTDFSSNPVDNKLQIKKIKLVLLIFVQIHASYSRSPLISNNIQNVQTMLEIAFCLLELSKIIHESAKPQALIMSDFLAKTKEILHQNPEANLTIKSITELFVSINSGRQLLPLRSPPNLPSYFFTNVILDGKIKLGFNLEDEFATYNAKLCSDAMYLFETIENQSNHEVLSLSACIPLKSVTCDILDGFQSVGILTFSGIDGRKLPVIYYESQYKKDKAPTPSSSSHQPSFELPAKVDYHPTIYLSISGPLSLPSTQSPINNSANISSSLSSNDIDIEAELNKVYEWLDTIETVAWEYRLNTSDIVLD